MNKIIKNIKIRFYNAMCNWHVWQVKTANELAAEHTIYAMEHSEKAKEYFNKIIGIAPELEEAT